MTSAKGKKTKASVSRDADKAVSDAMLKASAVNKAIDSIVSAFGAIQAIQVGGPAFSRFDAKVTYLLSLKSVLVPNLKNNLISMSDIDRRELERTLGK